ncbi:uncharacterized protein LOC113517892 [Galleria mellonella]|uniref:Uncharacterized protein LOC113517892 n=1 Tax=Galleria mellonella TaxID=7137 RepID=A0A6J1WS24_GALME|nr:uncharacterized protein LOC113517892 [Galleria mellonella]
MVNGVNMIIYVDYVLLSILFFLILFTCGYCFYRVHGLRRNGQIGVLLRPTKVVFSHKREGDTVEQLRTVVAYQNPFTGDYCVHKSRVGQNGYLNSVQIPDSPDSGVSDEYEPLNLDSGAQVNVPEGSIPQNLGKREELKNISNGNLQVNHPADPVYDNSVNKTWNWTYKEYQI